MRKKFYIALGISFIFFMLFSYLTVGAAKDTKTLAVVSTSIKNNQKDVGVNFVITVKFSSTIYKGNSFGKITLVNSNTNTGITASISKDALIVKSKTALNYSSSYTFTIPVNAVKDEKGNFNKTLIKIQFKTQGKPAVKPVPKASPDRDQVILFSDSNLEAAIREEIYKPSGNILQSDVKNISSLFLAKRNITKLDGLQNFTALRTLDLQFNNISAIDQLSGLKNLKILLLNNNKISELSPLSSLVNLQSLLIYNNNVQDISALKNMKGLQKLYISDNRIADLSALAGKNELKELGMNNNPIINASNVLLSLSKLERLDLWSRSYNADELRGVINQISEAEQKADGIIKQVIKPGMSDYEKELALHDYIVSNTNYDYDNYLRNAVPKESFTSYGVLVQGTGVCNGFANAMSLLLNKAGIECRVIVGNAFGALHAWNIVKLDGEYYHLDATGDNPGKENGGSIMHTYFNLSDEQISRDHYWEKGNYPLCSGLKYNYTIHEYGKEAGVSSKIGKLSGVVSFPDGMTASSFGYYTSLNFITVKDEQNPYIQEIIVHIPAGGNSAEFSVNLPANVAGCGYVIEYLCDYQVNETDTTTYVCYYNTNGTVIKREAATVIDISNGDKAGIRIKLPSRSELGKLIAN